MRSEVNSELIVVEVRPEVVEGADSYALFDSVLSPEAESTSDAATTYPVPAHKREEIRKLLPFYWKPVVAVVLDGELEIEKDAIEG